MDLASLSLLYVIVLLFFYSIEEEEKFMVDRSIVDILVE